MLTHGNLARNIEPGPRPPRPAGPPRRRRARRAAVLPRVRPQRRARHRARRRARRPCSSSDFDAADDRGARRATSRSPSSPACRRCSRRGSSSRARRRRFVRRRAPRGVGRGAAARRRRADGFRERFGVAVHEGYGLTEAAPIVTTTAVDDVLRPGSIGPPLPGRRGPPRRRRRRRRARRRPRRDLGAGPERVPRLLARPRGDRRASSPPTAGCAPATSPSPTTTATSACRPGQGPRHRVGLQRVPGRGRGGARRAPRRRRRRGRRRRRPAHRRGGRRVRRRRRRADRSTRRRCATFVAARLARYKVPGVVRDRRRRCPATRSASSCAARSRADRTAGRGQPRPIVGTTGRGSVSPAAGTRRGCAGTGSAR